MILLLNIMENIMKKLLNLKQVTMSGSQNTGTFFAKGYTPNWSEEIFVVKK